MGKAAGFGVPQFHNKGQGSAYGSAYVGLNTKAPAFGKAGVLLLIMT